jgi:hypothetical protein
MYRQIKAQTSIDFLVGMVIFIGALLFVFQFLSGTILPFTQGADEKTVTVDRVSDSLYYEKMGTDEKGVIDPTYLYDKSENEVISEEELLRDLNVDAQRHGINVTVVSENGVDEDDVEVVEIDEDGLTNSGEPARIGDNPVSGSSINKATRVGYVKNTDGTTDPQTVVVRIRMW